MPKPSAAVFQFAKVYPVFTNEPVFPRMVTEEFGVYGEEPSVGGAPLVLVLPL